MNMSNILVCPGVAKQVPFFDKQLFFLHLRLDVILIIHQNICLLSAHRLGKNIKWKKQIQQKHHSLALSLERNDASHFSRMSKTDALG